MRKGWVVEKNANKWMARAISNLELAKALGSEKIRYEDRCYLCSRSVEYSIKTLMILKLGKYKRGHNLDDLINESEKNGITIPNDIKTAALQDYLYEKAFFPFRIPWSLSARSSLTENTTKTRYPADYPPITKKGYEQALIKAEMIVSWVNRQFDSVTPR